MKRELFRLVAGQICLHACMTGMRLASPLMALREGYSEAAVGLLLAMFALTQVFLALPAGRFVDRHGMQPTLRIGIAMACVGALLAVAWPLYPVLCLSALLTGGATGAVIIALQRHVGHMAENPVALRSAFSWLSVGPAASNFVGPLLAGLLIDHAGFRAAFALMARLPWLAWLWVRGVAERPSPAPPAASGPQRVWDLLRDPPLRRLLLVNWFLSSCWDVHTFMVPVLGHERGISASAIGMVLGTFALAATLIRFSLPWMAGRFKEWQVITAAMLMTGGMLAVYPFTATAWAMGVCSGLLGLSLGSVQPMVMSTLHQITPERRQGEALGLRLMTINASSVLMPMVFGATSGLIGVAGVFWCLSAVVTSGARVAWRLRADKNHG
jgi:predicted MFS family arabinose efflux permease